MINKVSNEVLICGSKNYIILFKQSPKNLRSPKENIEAVEWQLWTQNMTKYPTVRKCNLINEFLNTMILLSVDGCTNYKVLSGADRAQGNTLQNNFKCDDNLVTGWYRIQGGAGDRMPDKCVLRYRCGTEHPGWLDGTHPTVAEGVVTRKACYYDRDNCCYRSNAIKVKNCSSYYVYELPKSPTCNLRYCGNAGDGKLRSISEWF